MKVAPLGAFGAMAYTIGRFGPSALGNLLNLMLTFYVTSLLFVLVVLGIIARIAGFSILSFLRYIKDELLIVLGTSSSESALPSLMAKLERLGCSKQVVGLVVPTGYSFNLDGTNIYMTLATLFIAQALHVDLSIGQLLTILLVAMLTSKGASGVTGAGFVVLAGTLAAADARLVPGLAIVFGIDKFMSEVRALTNIVGNGVACVVVSWWEGELDRDKMRAAFATDRALRKPRSKPRNDDQGARAEARRDPRRRDDRSASGRRASSPSRVDREGDFYRGAAGVRRLGDRAAMTEDTVFALFSCTKAITATAVLQLVEQGRLDLDAPAQMPTCRRSARCRCSKASTKMALRDRGPAQRDITPRMLMLHTAGFGYDFFNADYRRLTLRRGQINPRLGTRAGLECPAAVRSWRALGIWPGPRLGGSRRRGHIRRKARRGLEFGRVGTARDEGYRLRPIAENARATRRHASIRRDRRARSVRVRIAGRA